jgi:hypothetical protein
MNNNLKHELLNKFGKALIDSVRDRTIEESFRTLKGEIKDKASTNVAKCLSDLTPIQSIAVKDTIIDSIDGALNNFLWMLEQNEAFDLVAGERGNIYSQKEVSDGLSVDYWNFVDDFSKFKRL